jgi:hypothetical protein
MTMYYRRARARAGDSAARAPPPQQPQSAPLPIQWCIGVKRPAHVANIEEWERSAARAADEVVGQGQRSVVLGISVSTPASRARGEAPREKVGMSITQTFVLRDEPLGLRDFTSTVAQTSGKVVETSGAMYGFWSRTLTTANAQKTLDISYRTLKRVPTTLAKGLGFE